MSADNWTICPRCRARENEKLARMEEKVRKSYGKVTPEEYERLLGGLSDSPPLVMSMREDYEIGMGEEGDFFLSYSCSCNVCGFEWKYRHEEKVTFGKQGGTG